MEYEITEIPSLQPGEITLVEMHSLLNLLNILQGELVSIGLRCAEDPYLLRQGLAICERVKLTFTDAALALQFAARVEQEKQAILAEIAATFARLPAKMGGLGSQESLSNIHNVMRILTIRAQETLARAGEPGKWIEHTLTELSTEFVEMFDALEKNSHGRYRILYNLAQQQPTDYYISMVLESSNGRTVHMPLLFKDVMRDLAANARKYSAPGGIINFGLEETATELRFVVQDDGYGIPPDEIQTVVHYGQRGSNVQHVRTMGGGYGLTKAFLVSKRFGGRLWIKSELEVGTRITIVIPRPVPDR